MAHKNLLDEVNVSFETSVRYFGDRVKSTEEAQEKLSTALTEVSSSLLELRQRLDAVSLAGYTERVSSLQQRVNDLICKTITAQGRLSNAAGSLMKPA
uniref:Uncharacterized protein n=1 Tax=Tetraselmis sp. GSL018 TaxID=582737 RepID=A0A061QUG1_9CHLO|mmetsp:Transcript_19893/g.47387  ORF Transcript_19893/g.47387 Transcript_19893/m.47387 type:complete len:98 (-) Transcript_19893:173-466(-)|eukprot:CAMPEP_0177608708 /NCGR_PEP_ID=MMETSP0419_2-20121207/18625_1 /TAXON_ID=582737 /ORGANISM="Tetraselmis sp., Strain GSL018" /LENGTH=97 /DNA_ID=CAMNT_0019103435 /DNA_START=52 /DNA_END=345 /DNA_ORIENTATION=+